MGAHENAIYWCEHKKRIVRAILNNDREIQVDYVRGLLEASTIELNKVLNLKKFYVISAREAAPSSILHMETRWCEICLSNVR